jgi:hypothetical protein
MTVVAAIIRIHGGTILCAGRRHRGAAAASVRNRQAPSGSISSAADRPPCDPVPLRRGQFASRWPGLQQAYRVNTRSPDRDDTDESLRPHLRRLHVFAAEMPSYQALSADDFR